MKVRVVEWREYVPDCPADLEITSEEILGILTVDATADQRQQELIDRYKFDRIQEDYEGDTTRWFAYQTTQGRPPSESEKAFTTEKADEERAQAETDFDAYYGGYFNHYEYELDAYTHPYGKAGL